jgi:hypothetical protein
MPQAAGQMSAALTVHLTVRAAEVTAGVAVGRYPLLSGGVRVDVSAGDGDEQHRRLFE